MEYEILKTGSDGNCVLINKKIAIDIGIPMKMLEPYAKALKLVLLTHQHSDHFKPSTVAALHRERPTLRWGCCEWMVKPLIQAGVNERVIDVYKLGVLYHYPAIETAVQPQILTHNVPNCGYHILTLGETLFYATDTGTLDGIEAKNYDLYMVEANHERAELEARMEAKIAAGEFSYESNAAANHLSREQAEDWLYQNMGPKSKYVFLHQHIEHETKEKDDAE